LQNPGSKYLLVRKTHVSLAQLTPELVSDRLPA
jgi:hypothetical protein